MAVCGMRLILFSRCCRLAASALPIIAPAVPDKSARLRFFLTADHDTSSIEAVLKETAALRERSKTMSLSELASG